MKSDEHINKEVDETLRSLDSIERANPQLFFFTRVQARLEKRLAPNAGRSWTFRPALLAASLGLVLLLNVSALVVYEYQQVAHEQQQAAEHVADDWGIDPVSLDW